VVSTILSAVLVYRANRVKLVQDVKVNCLIGNQSTFYVCHDKGIPIDNYNDYRKVPDAMNAKVIQACEISQPELDAYTQQAAIKTEQYRANCITSLGEEDALCKIQFGSVPYTIGSAQVPENNTLGAVEYVIVDLVTVAFIFEVIRRIFYYAVLGAFRPKM